MSTSSKEELEYLLKFSKETLARMYMKARVKAEKYDQLKGMFTAMVKEDDT